MLLQSTYRYTVHDLHDNVSIYSRDACKKPFVYVVNKIVCKDTPDTMVVWSATQKYRTISVNRSLNVVLAQYNRTDPDYEFRSILP